MNIGYSSPQPPPLFEGRFKTVRKKEVHYRPIDSEEANLTSLGVFSGGGSGVGSYYGLLANSAISPSGAVVLGSLGGAILPAVSTGFMVAESRKVSYRTETVPYTPEEEWAAMTPLEQAHFKINAALEKWKAIRAPHKEQIQKLKKAIQQVERDVQQLSKAPLKEDSEEKRLESIRLNAKQAVLQEHQQLLSAAEKVYEALDQQILEREEKLIQGQEKLNMMQLQQGVIQMHEQLEKVKVSKETDAQNEPIMFEMEKQRVQIETVMASIQQALDVESVLKNMTIADAAKR